LTLGKKNSLHIGMAIGPIPYWHLQKIPVMGRVKPYFNGYGLDYG